MWFIHTGSGQSPGRAWEAFTHPEGRPRAAEPSLQVNLCTTRNSKLWSQWPSRQPLFLTVFRTLEFLTKHLAHLATLSTQTNMHARNLALVWAPNLLRWVLSSSAASREAFQPLRLCSLLTFLSSGVRTSRCQRLTVTWPSRRCGYSSPWWNLSWITQSRSSAGILLWSNPKKVEQTFKECDDSPFKWKAQLLLPQVLLWCVRRSTPRFP